MELPNSSRETKFSGANGDRNNSSYPPPLLPRRHRRDSPPPAGVRNARDGWDGTLLDGSQHLVPNNTQYTIHGEQRHGDMVTEHL